MLSIHRKTTDQNKKFVFQEKDVLPRNQYIEGPLFPKIHNPMHLSFYKWLQTYNYEAHIILEFILTSLKKSLSLPAYDIWINEGKLKGELLRFIYKNSQSRYKSFYFLK